MLAYKGGRGVQQWMCSMSDLMYSKKPVSHRLMIAAATRDFGAACLLEHGRCFFHFSRYEYTQALDGKIQRPCLYELDWGLQGSG